MQEIPSDLRLDDVLRRLDNGGRWWNMLSRAADGYISLDELAAAAQSKSKYIKPFMFLRMMLSVLPIEDRRTVNKRLSPNVQDALQHKPPLDCTPATLPPETPDGWPVIAVEVVCFPKQHAYEKWLVPQYHARAGHPHSHSLSLQVTHQPVTHSYRVYELLDDADESSSLPIAVSGPHDLPDSTVRVGGLLRWFVAHKQSTVSETVHSTTVLHADRGCHA